MIIESRWTNDYGFDCVITFNDGGYRCGYVGIPKNHPYFKKDYSKIHIPVNGGLTYSDFSNDFDSNNNLWYLGFDCNHGFEEHDPESLKKYYPDIYVIYMNLLDTTNIVPGKYVMTLNKTIDQVKILEQFLISALDLD